MARWITGLTVERRRVEVRAPSVLSAPECVTDPDDCCTETYDLTGGVGGPTCCPDADLAETVAVATSGPLGTDGATCAVDFDITRDSYLDPHMWNGEGTGTGGDCSAVRVLLKIWFHRDEFGLCEWFVSGDTFDQGGVRRTFGPVLMDDDGADLTAEAFLPGLDDTLSLVIERPCAMGTEVLFSVPGTYEWTVPAGVTEITVEGWGGGGAGGCTYDSDGDASFGGGGGGEYSRSVWTVGSGELITVIVGERGRAANWPNLYGTDSQVYTNGSPALTLIAHGADGGSSPTAGPGASGGTGDVTYSGGDGGEGEESTGAAGGGGGASGGSAAAGPDGTASSGTTPGAGGAAVTGGGAGGDGSLTNGLPGTSPGGGGGGAGDAGPLPRDFDYDGGDGGDGQVKITWA